MKKVWLKAMKLTILDNAHQWFQEELGVKAGEAVHFFGKYGGSTNVHTGFSTGMRVEEPTQPIVTTEIEGITYYIDSNDEWFFAGYDMTVDFDKKKDEPIYQFTES